MVPRTIVELFTSLGRANFRVDTLLEPEPRRPPVTAACASWTSSARWACVSPATPRSLAGPQAGDLAAGQAGRLRPPSGRRPPLVEAAVRLLLAERALVDADLEQHGQRLADRRARRDAEVRHHLLAVEVGTDRSPAPPARCSSAMRASSASMRCASSPGLSLVAGGAVAAGQLVELVEQVAGVADVAADGAVGPHVVAVAVEPQVQVHELADGVDLVVGVAQGAQPVAGHAGADHLVVVERHPVRPDGARLGLADVVEQRGQPHDRAAGRGLGDHRDRVGQHVLVAVDRVLLDPHGGQLGEETSATPGVDEEPQPGRRVLDHDAACRARRGPARPTRSRAVRRARGRPPTSSGSGASP